MRIFASFLFILLVVACNTGIAVHDGGRAAELVADCLAAFKSNEGIHLAYEWTDDRFKEGMPFSEFSRMVASIRNQNQGADIRLAGYEIIRSREAIIVYADSKLSEEKMYFKFILSGTKHKDYYLLDLRFNDSGFNKKGVYKEYRQSIVVKGV
ncbi:MAG: hypothetical protein OEO19_14780 [Gammaproteobacteria bacterium]|nr:hypothetical protein [Gammaproteobacteria bacterium]MDH3447989.1 hypothetical protein [Gammaproteobacteria bacterium]